MSTASGSGAPPSPSPPPRSGPVGDPAVASPWSSPDFRFLLLGQTVSAFGNAVNPVAVAFAVISLGGTAAQLGLVLSAYAAAQVATTLLGGVLGDRLPRTGIIRTAALASGVVQSVVAASLIGGWSSLGLLAVAGFLTGIVGPLSGPNISALTAQTVTEGVLQRAITWRRLGVNLAMVLGFAVAGILVAVLGPGWAIAVDAASFFLAAGCYWFIRVSAPAHASGIRGAAVLSDAMAGLHEVLRHTWLWVLIAQALLFHLVHVGAQQVLGPIVVQRAWGEAAWGWAMAMIVVGFVAGGLLTLRWRPPRLLYAGTAALALTGAFPAALAAGHSLPLLLVGAFLHGLGLEVFGVAWDLAIQQNVRADTLSRVYAVDIAGSFLARPVGLVLAGPIAEALGMSRWLWIVAATVSCSALACLLVPQVRSLVRTDLDPAPPRAAG